MTGTDKAIEKPALDLHGKILLIRSKKELPKGLDKSKSKGSRKKINLPVTDCADDPNYEKDVPANYQVPSSYVRYVRRVGNEADMSVDYNMDLSDQEWMNTHPVLSTDKDCRRQMDADIFEAIMNILEHHTAFSRDPIPQAHADKLVAEAFGWSANLSTKILPAVYQYWLKKRASLKKPLCRPYWPQTPAADQHPHLTFRPRAAEKYRLRRQHRKNDLESFRKMKQLKAEFARAYDLLCLVIEREGLREAELIMQQEIFEQTLFDIDRSLDPAKSNVVGNNKRRRPEPYAYSLTFEELLKEPEPPSAVTASLYGGIRGYAVPSSVQHKHQQAEEARRQQKRNKEMQAVQRRKREGDHALAAQQAAEQVPVAPVYHSAYEHQRALEENALQHVHANVPGPRTACRPPWPHFLSADLDRSSLHAGLTTHGYMEILRQADDMVGSSLTAAAASASASASAEAESTEGAGARGLWEVYGLGSSKSRIGNDACGVASRLEVDGGAIAMAATTVIKGEEGTEGEEGEGVTMNIDAAATAEESAAHFKAKAFSSLSTGHETGRDQGGAAGAGEEDSVRLVGIRSRGRVGRGGRLVVDRMPILSTETGAEAQARAKMRQLSAAISGRGRGGSRKSGGRKPPQAGGGDGYPGGLGSGGGRTRHIHPTSLIPPSRPFSYKPAKQAGAASVTGSSASSSTSAAAASTTATAAATAASSAAAGVNAGATQASGAPSQAQATPASSAAQGVPVAAASTAGAQSQAQQAKAKAPVRELVLLPPTQPPERAIIAPHFAMREMDYYACSDSEGEDTFVPALATRRGLVVTPSASGEATRGFDSRSGQGQGQYGGVSSPSSHLPPQLHMATGTGAGAGAGGALREVGAAARGMGLFHGVGAVPKGAQPAEKFRLVV
jgi:hypothetical protein